MLSEITEMNIQSAHQLSRLNTLSWGAPDVNADVDGNQETDTRVDTIVTELQILSQNANSKLNELNALSVGNDDTIINVAIITANSLVSTISKNLEISKRSKTVINNQTKAIKSMIEISNEAIANSIIEKLPDNVILNDQQIESIKDAVNASRLPIDNTGVSQGTREIFITQGDNNDTIDNVASVAVDNIQFNQNLNDNIKTILNDSLDIEQIRGITSDSTQKTKEQRRVKRLLYMH